MLWLQVITKQVDGHKYEPFEEAVVEVPEEHVGPVVDMLGQRKGQMMDLVAGTDTTSLTRSGLRLRATKQCSVVCPSGLAELLGSNAAELSACVPLQHMQHFPRRFQLCESLCLWDSVVLTWSSVGSLCCVTQTCQL